MRDASPGPMLRAYARRSLNASMSRKSSASVPAIGRGCHVAPPSMVRRIVPFAPLAHAIDVDAALIPRSRAVVPLDCGRHSTRGAADGPAAMAIAMADAVALSASSFISGQSRNHHRDRGVDDDDDHQPAYIVNRHRGDDVGGKQNARDAADGESERRA